MKVSNTGFEFDLEQPMTLAPLNNEVCNQVLDMEKIIYANIYVIVKPCIHFYVKVISLIALISSYF